MQRWLPHHSGLRGNISRKGIYRKTALNDGTTQRKSALTREKRQRIKQGGLFIPWVFSFGAELEGLPLREYLEDATKLSNTLRTIHNYFKYDGIVSQGNTLLLAEALEYGLDQEESTICSKSGGSLPADFEKHVEQLPQNRKVATAIDVIQRLNILLPDTPLLNIVPGPYTLARQLTGLETEEASSNPELLRMMTKVILTMVKSMGDAGADMLIIHEEALPKLNDETAKLLRRCYAPLWNSAKFYELSPLLMLGQWLPENADRLAKIADEIIFPTGSLPDNQRKIKRLSLSLPVSLLEKEPQEIQNFLEQQEVLNIARESRLFLLSTDVEIPSGIHKESLIRGVQTIKDAINQVLPH